MIDFDEEDKTESNKLRPACLAVIAQGFDAVQIIATRYDIEEGSVLASDGLGNFYTRTGIVDEWREITKVKTS